MGGLGLGYHWAVILLSSHFDLGLSVKPVLSTFFCRSPSSDAGDALPKIPEGFIVSEFIYFFLRGGKSVRRSIKAVMVQIKYNLKANLEALLARLVEIDKVSCIIAALKSLRG